jgi:cbb3-type cytochrome oxidase cytochrome c subunit
MKGLLPLFLGIFGTFAFSWTGLIFVPNLQIGHLDPQMEEDGTDVYPAPRSGMAERGRQVYAANGCNYCHTQQIRADYAGSDLDRIRDADLKLKWGVRRSAPRDYIFDRPILLGKMRMGPDLANIGHLVPVADQTGTSPAPSPASPAPSSHTTNALPAAAQNPTPSPSPSAPNEVITAVNGVPIPYTEAWHHRHLYNPRSINLDSDMPAFRFLYEKHQIAGQVAADALNFDESSQDAPPPGWEIVPTYEAKCLVAYLMSLDQSHPLKEVKTAAAPASPAAPGKQAK